MPIKDERFCCYCLDCSKKGDDGYLPQSRNTIRNHKDKFGWDPTKSDQTFFLYIEPDQPLGKYHNNTSSSLCIANQKIRAFKRLS